MKNLIRKILKEEGGFKDSTEEDWEWTKGEIWDEKIHPGQNYHYVIPPNSISKKEWESIHDVLRTLVSEPRYLYGSTNYNSTSNYEKINKGIVMYLDTRDDYISSYHMENHMPFNEDWEEHIEEDSIEIPLEHLLELSKRIIKEEVEGFLDSSEEDWGEFKDFEEDYSGYYVFDPPINKDQWLDVLDIMENTIPNIVWSSGNKLSNSVNMFPKISEIYGLSINTDYSEGGDNGNKLRVLSNLTWSDDRDGLYNKMKYTRLPTHDGREFFDIE